MSKEAIAHYEAALKEAFPRGATGEVFHHWNEARYLIATEALDRMAENARELGLDYEPVCNKDPQGCWNVRCQLGKKCKNTPAQRTWVGLTDEDKAEIKKQANYNWETTAGEYASKVQALTEAKLKEKNK